MFIQCYNKQQYKNEIYIFVENISSKDRQIF